MPLAAVALPKSLRMIKYTLHTSIYLPILWWRWHQVMHAFKPDIVIWTSTKQALLLLPWLDKTPSFVVEHTNVQPSRGNAWLYGILGRKLSGFVAVSEFMRGHLERVGAPPGKISVVRNGAIFQANDLKKDAKLHGTRAPLNEGTKIRLGIVGQVSPHKGHHCLVEAVRLLHDRQVKVSVRVFGGGPPAYTGLLKARIAAVALSDAWQWMGYEQDQSKIFANIDILLVPSCFDEPFGMVAAEASAYGVPVVASRKGGLPEIVEDGVTGWLVDANAPGQLADKIEWLIRNPQQARDMGIAGRERVLREFTIERMVAEFESLFRKHLNRN